jgi:Flp pilus assembly protein TadG
MTMELAILAPVLLLLLGVLVLAGRVEVAGSAVEQAARSAARDASLARTADAGRAAAVAAADRELTGQGIACAPSSVAVDTTGFATPVGQSAVVTVTVACSVSFADLAIPGLPGMRTIHAEASSPLDRYRSR